MAGTINKVILIGHLGDEVKMHYFEGGNSIGRFPLATNETYTNRQTGEKVTNVEFLNSFDNDDVDTLGGLIFSITGRVPQRGEIIKHTSGTTFEIKDADPMKIKSVKVTTPKK